MEQVKKMRFGNVVQYPEFDKSIRLEKAVAQLEKVFIKNGFYKCHVPVLSAWRQPSDSSFEAAQDLYKLVGGDGQILALPGDPMLALLNSLVLKRNENARYFGRTESFSFLKPTNPQNGYYLSAVLACADGHEADAEICALAIELAESIGLSGKLHVGNTAIAQGIVEFYSGKVENKEKISKIIHGQYESEADYAAAQVFAEMKKLKDNAPKEQLRLYAEKVENQKSLDGLLDVYEVLNLSETHDIADKMTVDPLYVGEGMQTGTVFFIGEETPVIFGGKSMFTNGQDTMTVITVNIDLYRLCDLVSALPKPRTNRVGILVSDSTIAYQRAVKFKDDFLKNNLITDLKYKVTVEDAEKEMAEKSGSDYLVIYVDEKGNIRHN